MVEKKQLSEADLDRVQGASSDPEWKYVPVRRFAAATPQASGVVLGGSAELADESQSETGR